MLFRKNRIKQTAELAAQIFLLKQDVDGKYNANDRIGNAADHRGRDIDRAGQEIGMLQEIRDHRADRLPINVHEAVAEGLDLGRKHRKHIRGLL